MSRSIKKAIADYRKMVQHNENRFSFYLPDYLQIAEISEQENNCDKYSYIHNATMAAFMIGYRTAKREEAEKRKKHT